MELDWSECLGQSGIWKRFDGKLCGSSQMVFYKNITYMSLFKIVMIKGEIESHFF